MEFLIAAALIGVIPALVARSKGRSFAGWWFYGAALFIVAFPHALLLKGKDAAPDAPATRFSVVRTLKALAYTVAGIFGFIMVIGLVVGDKKPGAPAEHPQASKEVQPAEPAKERSAGDERRQQISAYSMAKQFIEKRLISPGSAKFPSVLWNGDDIRIAKRSDGGYSVMAWVDAQNKFGALLRKKWLCEIKETSKDQWQVVGVCGLLE